MSTHYSRIFDLWRELKRRKVTRVITVYAASAFVILELVSIIVEPLRLPDWTLTLVIVLLFVGLIIAFVLSWIYDVTPEGIEKTKPVHSTDSKAMPGASRGWKIASYISFVVIAGLIALNIVGERGRVRIDESLTKSIAVLPFHNLSGDVEREFICDGLTDEIISHLYKVKSFDKVVSYTSVQSFKDPERNISNIAAELGVNYILEGSYKRMGDELKITAQLIEPMNDNHIWLHDYELPYSEVMGIPGEIAIQIADHLKAFLTEDEQQRIRRISTSNQEAYELLKQADLIMRTVSSRREFSNIYDQIMELCLEAISLDPNFAEAYAGVAASYVGKGNYIGGSDMQTMYWEARPYMEKALDLDPDCYMAHAARSMFNDWVLWDYIEAEKEFSYIADKYSNDEMMISQYVEFLTKMNKLDEALSLIVTIDRGPDREVRARILAGTRQEGVDAIVRYLHETDPPSFFRVGEAYIWLDAYDSARFYLEKAQQSRERDIVTDKFKACLALAYYKTGETGQAESIIHDMFAKSDTTSAGSPEFFVGWYYSWIGEADSAFIWLEKAYNHRSPEMPWLKVDPAFNSLKDDPRYWDLYKRTGHKAYDEYMASRDQ